MCAEIIREKALKLLDDEVPHGIYVEVENFKDRVTSKGQDIYDIDATIYCLRESHKGIIIGKGGNLLKRIASYARQDLEKMLDTKVNLKELVKDYLACGIDPEKTTIYIQSMIPETAELY